MSAFMTEQSGPYVVSGGGHDRTFDTRQALYDFLHGLTEVERGKVDVSCEGTWGGMRHDFGDYIHDVLRMEVENPL